MELKSPAFKDGWRIPRKYATIVAGGDNTSLPLEWSGYPAGTKSFAISVVDIHPIANNWVHWLVINIPANITSLPEGASVKKMPPGSVELINSYGDLGYGGPQPPIGTGDHSYVVTVYALNTEKINLPRNATLSQFNKAIEGKILDSASITGKYGR
ncbi:MAG: YbhB/YbcL family Raf kinase inhibitor-like protein [Candidatus Aenigmatarchaeota archaeon]